MGQKSLSTNGTAQEQLEQEEWDFLNLSSSDNSSIPIIAIISCSDLYFCNIDCTYHGRFINIADMF